MICRQCIRRAAALPPPLHNVSTRPLSTSLRHLSASTQTDSPSTEGPTATTSTSAAQPFSTPLTARINPVSLGTDLQPKPVAKAPQIPVSSCPAGTTMKGLNFLKGRDDPVALPEEDYPEWLWRCLDAKAKTEEVGDGIGDEFSKSKKLRRKAAKAQRKIEAKLLASGDTAALQPKIPITKQSIDLPANEEGTVEGALEAGEKREELRTAMRRERRAKIKETNFLKAM